MVNVICPGGFTDTDMAGTDPGFVQSQFIALSLKEDDARSSSDFLAPA